MCSGPLPPEPAWISFSGKNSRAGFLWSFVVKFFQKSLSVDVARTNIHLTEGGPLPTDWGATTIRDTPQALRAHTAAGADFTPTLSERDHARLLNKMVSAASDARYALLHTSVGLIARRACFRHHCDRRPSERRDRICCRALESRVAIRAIRVWVGELATSVFAARAPLCHPA